MKASLPADVVVNTEVYRMDRFIDRAVDNVVAQMRRDTRPYVATLIRESEPDGSFEFKDIPVGDYRAVAVGRIGEQEFIWNEPVTLISPIPQYFELKNRHP